VSRSLLLDAADVRKSYGAVAALRGASLQVAAGEVHALMGANGAGKSTLVKILTGAVHPDGGRILVRGEARSMRSPAQARSAGVIPVYQEPALVPDLDVEANLRLTATPTAPFLEWVRTLGIGELDLRAPAHTLPLAVLRILDLARALALEPDVLLLDEITAALPADLAERVLDVVRRQGAKGRSVIFISHRFAEISALCDRATVLRDGRTVGSVDIEPGVEERIVDLMLGTRTPRGQPAGAPEPAAAAPAKAAAPPRVRVKALGAGTKLADVSFDLHAGEVLGVFALEGQGQDELFGVLSGFRSPSRGTVEVDGMDRSFGHPADAIRAGLVYLPGNRVEALLMQRSVRENIALPMYARMSRWGPIDMARERERVNSAIARLQIDTRAQGEVRRLSGGNQQKVTIARWIARGVDTLLCFDPTRGIDIRTKGEIYPLLREVAGQGASVLFYTSEAEEVQRACDRVVVLFGGRVTGILPAAAADEPALMRAAHGLSEKAGEAAATSPTNA